MRNLSNDVTKPSYSYIHIIGIHEVHEKAFSLTVKWLRNIEACYLPHDLHDLLIYGQPARRSGLAVTSHTSERHKYSLNDVLSVVNVESCAGLEYSQVKIRYSELTALLSIFRHWLNEGSKRL